jgi:hypothetical protein
MYLYIAHPKFVCENDYKLKATKADEGMLSMF